MIKSLYQTKKFYNLKLTNIILITWILKMSKNQLIVKVKYKTIIHFYFRK